MSWFLTFSSLLFAVPVLLFGQPSPQELLESAMAAQRAGNFDEAIRDYRQILASYPKIAEIRSNLGAALAGKGSFREAITEYQKALAIKPDANVRLNLALAWYKTGDFTTAAKTLDEVHKALPQDLRTATLLADCRLRLNQNRQVIELLRPFEAANPDNRALQYLLGTALIRDGQIAQGQTIIDKILRNGDSAEASMLLGTTKYQMQDFRGALADFEKALKLNPNLPELNAYYGKALASTGDRSGAKAAFERELKADPNNFDSNLTMGVLLRDDQDFDGALKYFERALASRPGDFGVRYQVASIQLSKGQLDTAARSLESIVKEAPDFVEAHVSLATVYFRQKRKAEGEKERAIVARLNAERQARETAGTKP